MYFIWNLIKNILDNDDDYQMYILEKIIINFVEIY